MLTSLQIFSHSINDYCNKLEQLFAKDMSAPEEIVQPMAAPNSQKAWIEKARSTLSSLQGEKKIQAFFNFVPQVRLASADMEMERKVGIESDSTVMYQTQQH